MAHCSSYVEEAAVIVYFQKAYRLARQAYAHIHTDQDRTMIFWGETRYAALLNSQEKIQKALGHLHRAT